MSVTGQRHASLPTESDLTSWESFEAWYQKQPVDVQSLDEIGKLRDRHLENPSAPPPKFEQIQSIFTHYQISSATVTGNQARRFAVTSSSYVSGPHSMPEGLRPLPSIPFASPAAALDHIQSVFVADYYAKTLTTFESLLKPVTYTNRSGVSASVPSYVRELLAAYLKKARLGPQSIEKEFARILQRFGLRDAELLGLSRALGGTFHQALSQMLQVRDGTRLEDHAVYKGLLDRINTAGNDAHVFAIVDRLLSSQTSILSGMFQTGYVLPAQNGIYPTPLANIRVALETQAKSVRDSMSRISAMTEPGQIAHIIKTFSGDIADVHWIYDQLGIPKTHGGKYLVDEIYERLKTVNVSATELTPILAPLARDSGVDEKTWRLCLDIAKEKKKIEFQETALMVLAVGGSIAAVVGGAVVAGPGGAVVAGGAVSMAIGGADVAKAERRLSDVTAANAAHRLANLPLADDEHLEIVAEARDYAVDAAVANTLLAIAGGVVSPALGAAARVMIPGKTLTQVTLRALLNTSLQGGYGAADGLASASLDDRQTDQSYLDRAHEKKGGTPGEAPRALHALVFSAALGGAFGVGAETAFGSGKFEILCALDGQLPTIIDAVTGRVLTGLKLSPDGGKLIAPNGESRPIVVNETPRVVVSDESVRPLATERVPQAAADASDVAGIRATASKPSPSTAGAARSATMPTSLAVRLGRLEHGKSLMLGRNYPVAGMDLSSAEISGNHAMITHVLFGGFELKDVSKNGIVILAANGDKVTMHLGLLTTVRANGRKFTQRSDTYLLAEGDVVRFGLDENVPAFVFKNPAITPNPTRLADDHLRGENGLFDPPAPAGTRKRTPQQEAYIDSLLGSVERMQQVYVKRSSGVPEKGWYVLKIDRTEKRFLLIRGDIDVSKLDKPQLIDMIENGAVVRWTHAEDVAPVAALEGSVPDASLHPNDAALRFIWNRSNFLKSHETMDQTTFRQLFTGELRQVDTGNCFMVALFNSMVKSRESFEVLMRTSITKGKGYYDVKVPLGDPNGQTIRIYDADLDPQQNPLLGHIDETGQADNREFLRPVDGPWGFRILEAVYIKLLTGGVLDRSIIDKGGFSLSVMKKLLGDKAVKMGRLGTNTSSDSLASQKDKLKTFLENFNNGRDMATLSTKANPGSGGDRATYQVGAHTLFMSHAYSLERVQIKYGEDGSRTIEKIIVVNPHNTNQKMAMTFDEFAQAFWMIDATQIDLGRLFVAADH